MLLTGKGRSSAGVSAGKARATDVFPTLQWHHHTHGPGQAGATETRRTHSLTRQFHDPPFG